MSQVNFLAHIMMWLHRLVTSNAEEEVKILGNADGLGWGWGRGEERGKSVL